MTIFRGSDTVGGGVSVASPEAIEVARLDAETSASEAAVSAAEALASEGLADANAIATAADVVTTDNNVTTTNNNVTATNADVVLTNADVTYADEWATKAEDVLVSVAAGADGVTDYSALHWSAKASGFATTATTQASNASTSASEAADSAAFASLAATDDRGTGVTSTYVSTVAVGGTTFAQPAVNGEINSDEGYFTIVYAGATGITVATLTSPSTYVYIDNAGALQQQTSTPTRQDWSRKMFTMRIAVDTSTNLIIGFEYLNNPTGNYANSIRDVYSYLLAQGVPFKKDQVITGRAGDLGFDISSGSLMEFGGTGNIHNANIKSFGAVANAEFFLATQTTFDAGGNTDLPKTWDNAGTLTALGSTTVVGHRLYRFSNGNLVMQYGQGNYANMTLAGAGVVLENYILNPILKNATFFGWWLIESTATNTGGTVLTDFREYVIGVQGGSSSVLSGCLLAGNNLSDLLDASAARTNLGISATNTPNTPAGNIVATNVQATLNELDTEKAGLALDNVFTGRPTFETAFPYIRFNATGLGADLGNVDITASNGQFAVRSKTDANVQIRNLLGVNRDGIVFGFDGLLFPATQVPSADANTLDDYEEGTFTPTLYGTAVVGTPTYSKQYGRYTKVGNRYHFLIELALTNLNAASGNMRLSGLPFTSAAFTTAVTVGTAANASITAGQSFAARALSSSSDIALLIYSSTSGNTSVINTELTNTLSISLAGTIEVA